MHYTAVTFCRAAWPIATCPQSWKSGAIYFRHWMVRHGWNDLKCSILSVLEDGRPSEETHGGNQKTWLQIMLGTRSQGPQSFLSWLFGWYWEILLNICCCVWVIVIAGQGKMWSWPSDPSLTRMINIMTILKTLRVHFIYLSMGSEKIEWAFH